MKILASLILIALCSTAQAQRITIEFLGGLGVPVSDHQLLTVSHLGGSGIEDPGSDLMLVDYAAGTFAQWAAISYEPIIEDGFVKVAVQEAGITYHLQRVEGHSGNYLRTGPLLQAGDSGGGVFDLEGNLVGINYGIHPVNGNSYHISTFERAEWLQAKLTVVPEPGTVALLLVGLGAMVWRYRR